MIRPGKPSKTKSLYSKKYLRNRAIDRYFKIGYGILVTAAVLTYLIMKLR